MSEATSTSLNERIPLGADGSLVLAVSALSDLGCKRPNNEDSMGVFADASAPLGSLLVVADGMGGAAAGELASRMAVDTVREQYYASGERNPKDALRRAIEGANAAIHARAEADPAIRGMGTTCTAVAILGSELWFGHVGDSRAYVTLGAELSPITRDHSLASELGQKAEPGSIKRGARNVLTRCLGVKPEVKVDVSEGPAHLELGTVVVLCSDGLCDMVKDEEIAYAAAMHLPDGACKKLVELARERGAPDNVTVQVGRVTRG